MTRNITVQFDDGSSHVYQGAPDDVTPEQVTERAQKEFNKKVVHLDGGRKAAEQPTKPAKTTDEHSSEEYETPQDKARMQALGVDPKAVKQTLEKVEKEGVAGGLKGVGESALSAVTGLGSTVVGGLAGGLRTAGGLLMGEGLDEATKKGTNVIQKVQQGGTYQPRSAAGQAINEVGNYAGQQLGRVGKYVGGEVGEAVGGEKGRIAGESIGEIAPAIARTLMGGTAALKKFPKVPEGINTRGANMLRKAIEADKAAGHLTAENLAAAQAEIDAAKAKGINLVGTEPLTDVPNLDRLTKRVDRANTVIRSYIKNRPEEAKAVLQSEIEKLGENVGAQNAANQAQEAATTVLNDAGDQRTKAASPAYEAARASDREALNLMDTIEQKQKDIGAGMKWKNDAVQQAGKWYQFSHEMGLKANELAAKLTEWSGKPSEKAALTAMEAEGGKPNPAMAKVDNYIDRANEGRAATQAAVDKAAEMRQYLDQWNEERKAATDKLAEKDFTAIQQRVGGLIGDLNDRIRAAGENTPTGQTLAKFRNQLLAEGQPEKFPSRLDDTYKFVRDSIAQPALGIENSASTSRILKPYVTKLGELIKDVSPKIKEGRELYEDISKNIVNPLQKSSVGYLAGAGAEATTEASMTRMLNTLQSDRADVASIAHLADNLNKVDKTAFPNMVQELFKKRLSDADKITSNKSGNRAAPDFVDSIAATQKERENLPVMIQKVAEANGATVQEARQAARGWNTLVQVMRSTGRIKDLGRQALEENGVRNERAISGATHPGSMGATTAFLEGVGNWVNKKAYANLAKVLTDPKAIEKMQQLANLKSDQKAAREAIIGDILLMASAPLAAPEQQGAKK